MNKFLTCRGFRGWSFCFSALFWSALSHASPQISPLVLTPTGSDGTLEATMTLTLDQERYECLGGVSLGQISMLICGDQRQAQAEFQSFNENRNAVLAVYQPGRQQGYLFLMKKQANGYAMMDASSVLTPGFGSLRLFERYILEPMKADFTEDQVFRSLPLMMKEEGSEVSISTLRDRVANKEYLKFKVSEETPPEEVPKKEEVPQPREEKPAPVQEPQPDRTEPPAEKGEMVNIPRPQPRPQRPPQETETTTVRIIRGADNIEVREVPRRYNYEDPFGGPVPKLRELKNPHGYDLRNMTLEEIEELERRGLIYRESD